MNNFNNQSKRTIYLMNLISTLLLGFFLISCADVTRQGVAFGIRHDVPLAKYEQATLNKKQLDIPDLSPVIQFAYSVDGKSEDEEVIASGILINSEWILTAAHNFYVAEEQSAPVNPDRVIVRVGKNPNEPEAEYTVDKIVLHPTWITQGDGFTLGNDVALVHLSAPITNIKPVKVINHNDLEPLGKPVWFAGFGDYSMTKNQDEDSYSKLHLINNILDRRVSGIITEEDGKTYSGGLLAFDFDSPDQTHNSLGDDFIGEDEQLLGTGTSQSEALPLEGTTVEGDSGGALFVKKNGQWVVAGILSGGAADPYLDFIDGDYGDISIFTRIADVRQWIDSVIRR
ncbi:trypsin [Bisgaardia hudsonensis]|uniref:Trypsin n=1 Tax=Bisgaardia hudsonensis TaxID=109472 RepID=A0A4R2N025_9PAST|nr:trypsin-like serine protease [Bisgaardia hudsonensis]QLB13317.1 hypothetical protein A6A11_06720 [Bisgaardia hudsonensis]TCP12717.1 trypsin [Bisgaardia hudsonensis]